MTIFRFSPIPVGIGDLDNHQFTEVNEALAAMYGYTVEEMTGRTAAELNLWPNPEQRTALLQALQQQGVVQNFEANYRKKSGQLGDLMVSAAIIPVAGRRHLVGMMLDVTERKRLENLLRLQGEILAQMDEGVNLVRISDGSIVYTNPKYDKLLGYAAGELIGQHISVVHAPIAGTPRKVVEDIIGQLDEKGAWEGEVANRKKDGTTVWSHIVISKFNHSGYGDVWVSVVNDITARQAAEAALRDSERSFSTMFRSSPIAAGISRWDTGLYVDVNDAFLGMFGFTREEVIGHSMAELNLWPSRDQRQMLCERMEKEGGCARICGQISHEIRTNG